MKRIIVISFLIFLVCPLSVHATETKNLSGVEDISGLYAECAAYFNITYHKADVSDENITTADYRQLEKTAMFYSLLLALDKINKDMAVEATNSKFSQYRQEIKSLSAERNAELYQVVDKYQSECHEAMVNPPNQLIDMLITMMNM